MDIKKPGKPSQVNRVKISYCFFKRLRTRWDIPKLKFGSSDWTRTSSIAPAVSGFQKMVSVFTIIFTSIFNAVLP